MRADEMWHIDTSVIRLLDGTRAYLHAGPRPLAGSEAFGVREAVPAGLPAPRHQIDGVDVGVLA
jgi:hypothetical protein